MWTLFLIPWKYPIFNICIIFFPRVRRCFILLGLPQPIWLCMKTGSLHRTRVKPFLVIRWTTVISLWSRMDRHCLFRLVGFMLSSHLLILLCLVETSCTATIYHSSSSKPLLQTFCCCYCDILHILRMTFIPTSNVIWKSIFC